MMRIGLLALVSVLVGTSLGVGLTWSEFHGLTNHFDLQRELADQNAPAIPKVVVDNSSEYDFGTLGQNLSGQHTFVIRNEGAGVLELSLANLSCGQCVETDFSRASVLPGQTTEVAVTFHTRKPGPRFSERAELITNDPAQDLLMLQIRGYVTTAVRPSVEEVILGSVSTNEPMKTSFRVFGYESDKLEVLSHELTNPEQSPFFHIESRPLEAAQIATEEHAKVGREVSVTIKPGLPLGAINQTIRLELQTVDKQTLELPVKGTVVSDLTVIGGPNYSTDINVLSLGTVRRSQGATATVKVLVKGPYRKETELRISSVDPPDAMRATLGEHTEIANGAVFVYPLSVEILKDSRIVNRLGTEQGKSGRVIIDTTHPQAKRLEIRVRFATE